MEGWGRVLMDYYGKDPDLRYEDPSVKYLGYYTDNGQYVVIFGMVFTLTESDIVVS